MRFAAAITRRSLLGASLLAVAACKHGVSPTPPRADPDAGALAAARAMELQILGTTTDPAAHAVHQQHLAALGGSVPSAVSTPIVGASLHRQLRDSTASLKQAAVAAADGAKAALFASIAASHEVLTHE